MDEGVLKTEVSKKNRSLSDKIEPYKQTLYGVVSISPVILLYAFLTIMPMLFAVYASLHDILLLNPTWEYVGLQNYTEVFRLEQFWPSLWRGAIYMVVSTVFQLIVGVYIALVLYRIEFMKRIITTVVFTSYLIPIVVIALVASLMFDRLCLIA